MDIQTRINKINSKLLTLQPVANKNDINVLANQVSELIALTSLELTVKEQLTAIDTQVEAQTDEQRLAKIKVFEKIEAKRLYLTKYIVKQRASQPPGQNFVHTTDPGVIEINKQIAVAEAELAALGGII
jgi:hypothetical protein